MVIVVGEETVELRDPTDCKGFHVETADVTSLGDALGAAGAGRMDGDDALVAVEWVKAAADEAGVGAGWLDDFEAMLGYARSKGWLTDDGAHIRAHVESPT